LLRQIIQNRWFALADLLLVLISGLARVATPQYSLWFTVLACLPWVVRASAGSFPFRRTIFDWLIALFVITAAIGVWAAYDKDAAWNKFWVLLLAVLLYYALSGQPRENLGWVARIFFSIGVGVSIYFFLTHDFIALPRKLPWVNSIGLWIMQIRPPVAWKPIHPNYVAGIAAIVTPFAFYPERRSGNGQGSGFQVVLTLSLSIVVFALLMTTSRGVLLAIVTALGTWVLWKILKPNRWSGKPERVFPILVLGYLILVVAVLYAGPASFVGSVTARNNYGSGNRAELLTRSLYFLRDFPFTGGGLDGFPGLYSHYILGIPFFYVLNSHNLFLDVAIEQGVFGGLSYLIFYLASIWIVSRSITMAQSAEIRAFGWLTLFALMISFVHGMVDDYLYNGNGALLALFLVGISVILEHETLHVEGFVFRPGYRKIGFAAVLVIAIIVFNLNRIPTLWYANLAAVQMSRVELAGFPKGKWDDARLIPQLHPAEASLHSALQANPYNPTANYRLGLISMLRQDFESAAKELEITYKQLPGHRGVIKNLGYCYVWLGDMEHADTLLVKIPEARGELNVYVWWWKLEGRADLSERASLMISRMKD
jgi:O-antigen ligase